MALFGSAKDVDLFRKINKELLYKIIDTEIALYGYNPNGSDSDLRGETDNRFYYEPIRISCLINRSNPVFNNTNGMGTSFNQNLELAFLTDTLKDLNLYPKTGDIIEWDNDFYEITTVFSNQYFSGKNQVTDYNSSYFGYDVSVIVNANYTKRSSIQILEHDRGHNG